MSMLHENVYTDLNNSENTADETLVSLARLGSNDSLTALLSRYLPIISRRALGYEHSFLEKDDLVQEGMIALLKAIHFFRDDRNASFGTFATVCINNSMRSAVKAAGRLKHMPLNSHIPLSSEETGDQFSGYELENTAASPETLVIKKEEFAFLRRKIDSLLSSLEREILLLYLKGCTYEQMAARLSVTSKSVDNALQRVRKKFGSVIL